MTKKSESIIGEDIKKVYLGNLNTVEFDLKLPLNGENGSKITWVSDNELFLKSDGSVTRPCNGIGDRKIFLHAYFEHGNAVKEKIYEVHILEQPCKVKILEILPLKRNARRGKSTLLPGAVVLLADNGHYFSRHVEWKGGNEQTFYHSGRYELKGCVKEEELEATLEMQVLDAFEEEIRDNKLAVRALDSGETVLLKGSQCYDEMQRMITYLKSVDENQMLFNFRKTAGLDTLGAAAMEGWDSPECLLRGHTTGHFMSALALCYRETKDEEIHLKLHYLVQELFKCQKNFCNIPGFCEGYLGAYSEEQFDYLEKGECYPNIWAPYYTLHKVLAGFLDAYKMAGENTALEAAKQIGMWIYNRLIRLSKRECEQMWDTYIAGEFGGINESLATLYKLTGKKEYLDTARMFDNDRLFVPMQERYDILEGMHANQHIPQAVGCLELFCATGEKRYYDIAAFFWEAVTRGHVFANGGVGENEMFFEPDGTAEHLTKETTEFCASYNMLKLTKALYQYAPNVRYMDYYERVMLNHIAAAGELEPTGETSYFYPMAPGSVKESKFANSCCHGTGMESQMKYTEAVYFHSEDILYVNLFINSRSEWMEKGIKIVQQVKVEPNIIHLCISGAETCQVKVRCPYWCEGKYDILENNGKPIAKCDSDGYINIQKTEEILAIEINFFCGLRVEPAKGSTDIAALAYGPYILAALSDQDRYLEFQTKGLLPEQEMQLQRKDGFRLAFQSGKEPQLTWVPLAGIGKEKYHVYWKMI